MAALQKIVLRTIVALVAWCAAIALADEGRSIVRIKCDADSDLIEIELFIAWDQESPYAGYNANVAAKQPRYFDRDQGSFYSHYEVDPIAHKCLLRSRDLRIFVSAGELTVTESRAAPVDGLPLGDAWQWIYRYMLRSPSAGAWEECAALTKQSDFECWPFDPTNPIDARSWAIRALEAPR
jgi:hypothetical protein